MANLAYHHSDCNYIAQMVPYWSETGPAVTRVSGADYASAEAAGESKRIQVSAFFARKDTWLMRKGVR